MAFGIININGAKYKSHSFTDDTPKYVVGAKSFKCDNCGYVIYLLRSNDVADGQLYDGNHKDTNYKDLYDVVMSCDEQNIKNIIE